MLFNFKGGFDFHFWVVLFVFGRGGLNTVCRIGVNGIRLYPVGNGGLDIAEGFFFEVASGQEPFDLLVDGCPIGTVLYQNVLGNFVLDFDFYQQALGSCWVVVHPAEDFSAHADV